MLIIGIAGGTGSERPPSYVKLLKMPAGEVVLLPRDSYYKDSSHVPVEERQNINFDHPDAFDWGLLSKHVSMLPRRQKHRTTYLFLPDLHATARKQSTSSPEVIIIEGILPYVTRSCAT